MNLYIGKRSDSSWSTRPGALLRQAGIEHETVVIRFDAISAGSPFEREVAAVSPAGRVAVLMDGALVVRDALAERGIHDFEESHRLRRP